eukprot:GGOE01001868.1.p1 GENE.GGOE01001868.1~~GGOE01001868.1.p1  ORF type:complete len:475 (-),score=123.67 GGOE01001868.1:447-1808(-)
MGGGASAAQPQRPPGHSSPAPQGYTSCPPAQANWIHPGYTPPNYGPEAKQYQYLPYSVAPVLLNGRRKSVLVGINYFGSTGELRGCVNDVHSMIRFIEPYGFLNTPDSMIVLTDDQRNSNRIPTAQNIRSAIQWLVFNAQPGDMFFFHYSGHGVQVPDRDGDEADGMDEAICPVDYTRAGFITDDELFELLVQPLPQGTRLTCIMDCCHSGTVLDLPFVFNVNQGMVGRIARPNSDWKQAFSEFYYFGDRPDEPTDKLAMADVLLISGCKDSQTSADVGNVGHAFGEVSLVGGPGGALTNAFISVVQRNSHLTYVEVIVGMRNELRANGFSQVPQLSASQPLDVQRFFSLSDCTPNRNQATLQNRNKKFKLPSGLGMFAAGAAVGIAGTLAVDALINGVAGVGDIPFGAIGGAIGDVAVEGGQAVADVAQQVPVDDMLSGVGDCCAPLLDVFS